MIKKLFVLLSGTMLSVILLAGCNNNDSIRPVPKVNNNERINDLRNDNMNDLNNRNRNNNLRDNDPNDVRYNNNNVNDINDNNYSPREDMNTDTDKDPAKDSNTKREEIIEDDIDSNDRDRKDE